VANYTLAYRKTNDGHLNIHVEITLLKDSQWQNPPRFSIEIPIQEFMGATLAIVDSSGTNRSYTINDQAEKYEGYGYQTATITRDDMQISFEPTAGTALHVQDERTWGGSSVRVDLSKRQKWSSPFSYSVGEKLTFDANIIITGAGR
jgi:hypothetical protein